MDHLVALAFATLVLVALPGPNVALIIANSLAEGFRAGVITVLGTTAGVLCQLVIVAVGLTLLLETAADVFSLLRWAGVAYLLWLGIRIWRTPATAAVATESRPVIFWRSAVMAAVNPKTLLFNAAFLPQFVPVDAGPGRVVVTAAVFLAILFAGDLAWAAAAASAKQKLNRLAGIQHRLAGALVVAASRRPD